jgi:hypothetical protein
MLSAPLLILRPTVFAAPPHQLLRAAARIIWMTLFADVSADVSAAIFSAKLEETPVLVYINVVMVPLFAPVAVASMASASEVYRSMSDAPSRCAWLASWKTLA